MRKKHIRAPIPAKGILPDFVGAAVWTGFRVAESWVIWPAVTRVMVCQSVYPARFSVTVWEPAATFCRDTGVYPWNRLSR